MILKFILKVGKYGNLYKYGEIISPDAIYKVIMLICSSFDALQMITRKHANINQH